jgi:hypothetical protein
VIALVLVLAVTARYQPIECHTQFHGSVSGTRSEPVADGGQGRAVSGGCYVLNRWTGRVAFRRAFDENSAVAASDTPLERLRRSVGE